jgi:hypothetical protein
MSDRNRPLPPSVLDEDDITVLALQTLSDYQPQNALCSTSQLMQMRMTRAQARQAWVDAVAAAEAARKIMVETNHLYHNNVLEARSWVRAQYGADSAEIEIIGLTRKSQRKRPAKRSDTEV